MISFQQLLCLQISGPDVLDVVWVVAIYQERRKKLLIWPRFLNLLSSLHHTNPCPKFLFILPFQKLLPVLVKLKIMIMLSSDSPILVAQKQAAGKKETLHCQFLQSFVFTNLGSSWFSDENLILHFHSHLTSIILVSEHIRMLGTCLLSLGDTDPLHPRVRSIDPQRWRRTWILSLWLKGVSNDCGYTPDFEPSNIIH